MNIVVFVSFLGNKFQMYVYLVDVMLTYQNAKPTGVWRYITRVLEKYRKSSPYFYENVFKNL